jgi:hypothetical protein
MKLYERLAKEYENAHTDLERAYIAGFIKARELVLDLGANSDNDPDSPIRTYNLIEISNLGENQS